MDTLTELIFTLARESGGGGDNPLETLEPQGIRGAALLLDDGRVAVIPCKGGAADD